MGNQVHSTHVRVPRRPAILDGQMPGANHTRPQLITHPLRRTLLAQRRTGATSSSEVRLTHASHRKARHVPEHDARRTASPRHQHAGGVLSSLRS